MYSIVIIINNIVLYTLKLLTVDLKYSHHKKEMVIMWLVVIILQYVSV